MSGEVDLTANLDNPRTTAQQRRNASLAAARHCAALPVSREQQRDELAGLLDMLLREPGPARSR